VSAINRRGWEGHMTPRAYATAKKVSWKQRFFAGTRAERPDEEAQ